jgi:hypothetical protein
MRWRPAVNGFQVTTTVLILLLGGAILVRAGGRHAPLDSYGVGALFILYGLYRARFIWRFWRSHRTAS